MEAERIVPDGDLDPDIVVTPGIFVSRVLLAADRAKDTEQRTVRPRPTAESISA